jgi:site-specific DNA-methyltransferase (adenine-specific)
MCDNVLDNTCGSGSTCVAAVLTGRKYIGIEKDYEYYKIACERIKQAEMEYNMDLFKTKIAE